MPDPADPATLAASFGVAAAPYDRARPGYPAAALDWLLPIGARRVLDLGAGTGKLTASLLARGLEVTAIDPSEGMLAQLRRSLPDTEALLGSAESIPLPDGSFDVVLVAQAWHWVDPTRAVPEVARVLTPGGRLGLLWNDRDEREPWVAELSRILAAAGSAPGMGGTDKTHSDAESVVLGSPFGPVEIEQIERWTHELSPDEVVDLVASRSYVIALSAAAHAALLAEVRALLTTHPELAGRDRIAFPYLTDCVRADRLS